MLSQYALDLFPSQCVLHSRSSLRKEPFVNLGKRT